MKVINAETIQSCASDPGGKKRENWQTYFSSCINILRRVTRATRAVETAWTMQSRRHALKINGAPLSLALSAPIITFSTELSGASRLIHDALALLVLELCFPLILAHGNERTIWPVHCDHIFFKLWGAHECGSPTDFTLHNRPLRNVRNTSYKMTRFQKKIKRKKIRREKNNSARGTGKQHIPLETRGFPFALNKPKTSYQFCFDWWEKPRLVQSQSGLFNTCVWLMRHRWVRITWPQSELFVFVIEVMP